MRKAIYKATKIAMEIHLKDNHMERTARRSGTIESSAVESILRDSWNGKLAGNPHISDLIDAHAKRIRMLLGDMDYEIYVIDCVVANIKGIGREEAAKYLRIVEALAIGYAKLFGKEVAAVMLHGIVARSRNTKSLKRHYRGVNLEINRRIGRLSHRYDKESDSMNRIKKDLGARESGILRFFRRGTIKKLKTSMTKKRRRLQRLESGIIDYATVQSKLHNVAYGSLILEE